MDIYLERKRYAKQEDQLLSSEWNERHLIGSLIDPTAAYKASPPLTENLTILIQIYQRLKRHIGKNSCIKEFISVEYKLTFVYSSGMCIKI